MGRADGVRPPPRELKVQTFASARANELQSLHVAVAARLDNDFRLHRNKRRRTTSYDDRIARKKKRKSGKGRKAAPLGRKEEKSSRWKRRKEELRANPRCGFVESGDGTKRLRTHVWHAKRFTMVKRWGFFLPLGFHGSGRGSGSVLKWVKDGAVVHDASYCSPVQLQGPKDSILAVMKMVMVPSPCDVSDEASKMVASGVCHQNAMLYHVGTLASRLIAPVIYMWRPSLMSHESVEVEKDDNSDCHGLQDCNATVTKTSQLWVWIHAAAFNEAYDALQVACFQQTNETGVSVSCLSLEGQFARFEVMGSKAVHILQKLLRPVSISSSSDGATLRCTHDAIDSTTSHALKCFKSDHAEVLPSHAVLSFEVQDPRSLHPELVKPLSNSPELDASLKSENSIHSGNLDPVDAVDEPLSAFWMKPEENAASLSDSRMLWGSHDNIDPPLKENVLCSEKHQMRLNFFYMDKANPGSTDSGPEESISSTCPLLLLKNSNSKATFTWWSIILPLSWAKVFWIPLVSSGAHPIGLRERQWIACNNGLPSFPFDFPDSNSYSSFMASEDNAFDQSVKLQPPSARPLKVPIVPPWDCVRHSVERGSSIMEEPCVSGRDLTSSLLYSDPENHSSSSLDGTSLFSLNVARTSDAFINYLNKIDGDHLPLFSNNLMERESLSELIQRHLCSCLVRSITCTSDGRNLCFTRVVLRAFKGGVFEAGAVICAPTCSDISLWMSRSDEQEEKLQIPQSLVKSYFTEKGHGQWELQVTDDISSRQYHRWPIGFVTNGFVYRSSRPIAQAFCEASLLGQLRSKQWNHMAEKAKLEIFVLVRNLRSSAYRLAVATIVVEQQKEDLEFM